MATVMIMEPTLHSTKQSLTHLPEHEAKGTARRKSAIMTANVKQWSVLCSTKRSLTHSVEREAKSQGVEVHQGQVGRVNGHGHDNGADLAQHEVEPHSSCRA